MLPPLQVTIHRTRFADERLVVRVCLAGEAGVGSEGNHHGEQMRRLLDRIVEQDSPSGLILDLRELKYRFGNWIGSWRC
jgi:hypothetical protein